MALLAHYRLDGDATDSVGINDASEVNNVSWVNGKLGEAGDFVRGPGNGIWIPHDAELSRKIFGVSTVVSFAFWIYPRLYSNHGIIIGKQSGGSYSNSTSTVWLNSRGIRFQLGTNEGGNPSGSGSAIEISPPLNQWHHVACTCDGETMKMYVDGELATQGPMTLSRTRSENTRDIQIGTPRVYGYNEGVNALLDDVRIYDHTLSEREVRDLSLGLVTHLKFDGFNQRAENLLSTSGVGVDLTNWRINSSQVLPAVDLGNGWYEVTSTSTPGAMGIRGRVNESALVDGREYTVQAEIRNPSTSNNVNVGMDWCDLGSDTWTLSPGETRILTTTASRSTYDSTFRFMDIYPLTANASIEVRHPQIEEGTTASGFVDGVRPLYAVNSANTATTFSSDTARFSSDSVIGKTCYSNLTNTSRELRITNSYHVLENQTLAMWLYPTSFADRQNPWNRAYGGEGTITQEPNGTVNYYYGNNGGNGRDYIYLGSNSSLVLNQWNHVCHTRDIKNNIQKWYINGEQTNSRDAGLIPAASLADVIIGNGYAGPSYKGKIDDVRQYATALDDNAVKELYQQRASIDCEGNIHSPHMLDREQQGAKSPIKIVSNATMPVAALEDNTDVTVNGQTVATLNKSETATITVSVNDVVDSTNPIHIGYYRSGVPMSWRGTTFADYYERGVVTATIFSFDQAATVDIYQCSVDANNPARTVIVPAGGYVEETDDSDRGVWIFESSAPILVWIQYDTGDSRPVQPCSYERIGIPSGSPRLVAIEDNTTATVTRSDGEVFTYTLNRGGATSAFGTGSKFSGLSTHITADKPINCISIADSDGNEATSFTDRSAMSSDYVLGTRVNGSLAFAGLEPGATAKVYSPSGVLLDELATGGVGPTKMRFFGANLPYNLDPGTVIKCSSPQWAIFEENDDETNLYGSGQGYSITKVNDSHTSCVVSEVGVTRGLVAWYPLIGDTRDYAGTNDAVNNGAVETAEGYEFDGVTNDMTLPLAIPSGDPALTMSVVARSFRTDFGNWYGIIGTNTGSTTNTTLTINTQNSQMTLHTWSNSTSGVPLDTEWHVYTAVNTGTGTQEFYVDGQFIGDKTDVLSIPGGGVRLGRRWSSTRYWEGTIRDVRIYNVALTPEEVAIQAKLALSNETKTMVTNNCVYTQGQFKEVSS